MRVLLAIRACGRGAYDVSVARRMARDSWGAPSFGALHYAVNRLMGAGLITTRLEDGSASRAGRKKRVLEITPSGRAALARHDAPETEGAALTAAHA